MTTVGELFHSVKKDDCFRALIDRYYPGIETPHAGYHQAWDEIQKIEVSSNHDIICYLFKDGDVVHVDGRVGTDGVALEMTPWEDWLSLPIQLDEALEPISDSEVLAHILWEMTYLDYSNDAIKKMSEDFQISVEDLKDELGITDDD